MWAGLKDGLKRKTGPVEHALISKNGVKKSDT